MTFLWNEVIINPMTNGLLLLYSLLEENFILAIAIFTIIIRLATLPLNLRQQRSSMRMQELQPQIKVIQQKYRDNPQKMQEEFHKIGYNPTETLTGCLPLLIQMPVLFGLFRVLRLVLASTPQSLFELTQRVYGWVAGFVSISDLLPINSQFLWLNLGQPDPTFVLPLLVFGTMFLQQKYLSPAPAKQDDKKGNQKGQQEDAAASMQKSMQYTMPIMFGVFSLQFQAGLSVYFVLSNIIGIGQGWYTRRIMDAEREAQASKPKKVIKEVDTPEYELQTPDTMDAAKKAKKKRSDLKTSDRDKSKKSQSKRKQRSAKR